MINELIFWKLSHFTHNYFAYEATVYCKYTNARIKLKLCYSTNIWNTIQHMESVLYSICTIVVFVSEISLIRCPYTSPIRA